MLREWLSEGGTRKEASGIAFVAPDPVRCVQCGICSYNCPMGIDVRRHAANGFLVSDPRCLTCGECIARCPRGALRFEHTSLFPIEQDAEWEPVTCRGVS